MSMGYGAESAWIISEEKLEALNLPSWPQFKEILYQQEDLNEIVDEVLTSIRSIDIVNKELISLTTLWLALKEEFREQIGLGLDVGYHDNDDGSSYDDVDGVYYRVDGVKTFTPAGDKAFRENLIEKASWVIFC